MSDLERLHDLRNDYEAKRRASDQAQAEANAAHDALQEILTHHGVASVEELEAAANAAEAEAKQALDEVERALAQ